MNLVYNEHVEMVEVPIKPSDRLRARDMLGKHHKLFTDKKNLHMKRLLLLILVIGQKMRKKKTKSTQMNYMSNIPIER